MINNKTFKLHTTARAIPLALLALGAAHAQVAPGLTPPSAGQVLRELQTPAPTVPNALPAARAEPVETAPANAARVMVKSIAITGNQEIPTAELSPLVSSLVGSEQTLAQLNAAARRITAYYRSRGFAVARALLPAQDITSGAVTITVIEGRVSSSRVANTTRLPDALVGSYIGQVKPGDVIRSAQIDRGILLLQDTPGIASSRATLQPGASVGTSELLIEVTPAKLLSGSATLDNYGSRYTGEYRLGANLAVASPLGRGDQLSFSALTAGSGLSFGRLAYQIPVGSNGLRVGAAYFDTRYQLGREFASLNASGRASSTSVFAAYPFIRSPARNLSGTASYESKSLTDRVNATNTTTDKKIGVTSLGLSGNMQDAWLGGGINSADLTFVAGNLNIASPAALALDAQAQTNGSYSKIAYGLNRLQRISNSTQLAVSFNGQQASKNLDSSEKFSLGGINGVRAYPVGEATGDQGYKGTIELRHSYTANWQVTGFYDFGSITVNKNPFGAAAASNSRSVAGAGVGVNATFANIQLRTALAWRTSGGLPATIPASAAKTPTLLVLATIGF